MSHLKKYYWWAGAVVTAVVALATAAVLLFPEPVSEMVGEPPGGRSGAPEVVQPVALDAARKPDHDDNGLADLPPSLRGTTVDGQLRADENGHLVIDQDVRRVFDYFLSAVGEESPDRVLARIRAYAASQLPGPAAAEALQLLLRYLDWQAAAGELAEMPAAGKSALDPDHLRERLDRMQALQKQHLGREAADAFFADENRYSEYTIRRLALQEDESLSAESREQVLGQLDNQLPDGLRHSTRQLKQYQRLREITETLQSSGASAGELYQARAEAYGDDAASRLQALDQQRAQWQSRMDEWLWKRDALLSQPGLDAESLDRQLRQQRSQYFDSSELARVAAYERMSDSERERQ